jgi:hypothetical protein
MEMTAETLFGMMIGLGLSAACGFRVFVPPLVVSLAAFTGNLELSEGFQWLATYPAVIAFSAAVACEILGYYVPWVDNALDAVAAPAAVVAGTVLSASMVHDVSPLVQWTFAVIAGGSAAGIFHTATALLRGGSTLTTGGLGNPLLATAEMGSAVTMSLLAIMVPAATLFLLLGLIAYAIKRGFFHRQALPAPVQPSQVSQ